MKEEETQETETAAQKTKSCELLSMHVYRPGQNREKRGADKKEKPLLCVRAKLKT